MPTTLARQAAITFKSINATLGLLDAELYDENIPLDATMNRVVSIADSTANAITSYAGKLPEKSAHLLARAVNRALRRDVLAARDLIRDAIAEAIPTVH